MEFYFGQICLFAFPFTPVGFLPCQGQSLSISENQELYNVIGTTYGGDGVNTFLLPNTSDMSVVRGFSYAICVKGIYPTAG